MDYLTALSEASVADFIIVVLTGLGLIVAIGTVITWLANGAPSL